MSSPPFSVSPPKDSSHDREIRARLLNRLGIYNAPRTMTATGTSPPMTAAQQRRLRILRSMGVGYTIRPTPPDGSAQRDPLGGVLPTKEPLKADSNPPPEKPRRLRFQDEVEVVPIPTRYEYSDRIKSRIWSNRHELQENAERNAHEFAAEGWNWRNVTEDEGMYICSQSGELVHPHWIQEMIQEEEEAGPSLERGLPVHST